MADYIGAIDQGTTSTRFIVFDRDGRIVTSDQREHEQITPKAGWVEHDPKEVWTRTREVMGLLEDYFGEAADARRLATLRLMKFMSDFREAMWGVVQTVVSELDFDFVDYADTHFKRMLETAANPDFDAWLREASEPAG